MDPLCPNCGSALYSQDSLGQWRCNGCYSHKRSEETTKAYAIEKDRERLNSLFRRTVSLLRSHLKSGEKNDLYKARTTLDELTWHLHKAKNPEPVLRLKKIIEQEAQKYPDGARTREEKQRRRSFW